MVTGGYPDLGITGPREQGIESGSLGLHTALILLLWPLSLPVV